MVIAVIAVRMVKMTFHQVIGVVAVRHRLVPAALAVLMTGLPALDRMTAIRVLRGNLYHILIDVIAMR